MVQNNFGIGKVAKIIGERPTEEFNQSWMTKYTCATEEAELTTSQRQLQFLQAMQFKKMGIPISNKYLIEKSTLQGKKQIIEDIMQQEKQAGQIQQIQMQQRLEHDEILTRSLEAKAQNDFAAAEERRARATSDIALAKERTSQAVHDRASAALDNAKAFKELESIEEDRLIKLANFVVDLQARQKQLQGGEEEDSIQEALALSLPVEQSKAESKPKKMQLPQQPSGLSQAISQ
jgi:hypothetical protein